MATKGTGKGKKPHKNKPTSKKYKKYSVNNGVIKKAEFCPRCGPGIFLMISENRKYCGKCHYCEFNNKK